MGWGVRTTRLALVRPWFTFVSLQEPSFGLVTRMEPGLLVEQSTREDLRYLSERSESPVYSSEALLRENAHLLPTGALRLACTKPSGSGFFSDGSAHANLEKLLIRAEEFVSKAPSGVLRDSCATSSN